MNMRKFLTSSLVLTVVYSMMSLTCLARDDVSVDLKLDRTEATIMDSIRLVVKVSGARKIDSPPVIQGLDSFDVSQGGTSSRVEIVNGKMNSGIDYNYSLQPRKTGIFTIGPAGVKLNGKIHESNRVTLKIVQPQESSGDNRGVLFLSASLSHDKVYVGDQTIYTLKLYRGVNVSDISLRLPEAENLTFKQLGKPTEYRSSYNNQPYQVIEVRYALIPSKEGTFGIRPARMNLMVMQGRRKSPFDFFDDPFFSSMTGEQKNIASDPLQLFVLPLPEEGRPEDFNGLVGNFEIDSRLEPSELKTGDSATLTVVIRGRGDVKHIPDLKIKELEQVKVYSDQPVLNEELDSNGIKGNKIMKWALVPEEEGKYNVPQVSVSYFDTVKRKFRTLKSKPFILSVKPGKEEQTLVHRETKGNDLSPATHKKEVIDLGRDIFTVHGSVKDFHSGTGLRVDRFSIWLILIIPFLCYIGTFIGLKYGNRAASNIAVTKAKKAAKKLIRQSCRHGINSREMIMLFQEYLNDRLGLSISALTSDEAVDILLANNVHSDTTEEVRNLIRKFEDSIYTGKGDEPCEVHEQIQRLVQKLEKEIH